MSKAMYSLNKQADATTRESATAVENPEHRLLPEIAEALKARQIAAAESQNLYNEIGRTTEINEEHAKAQIEIYKSALEPLRLDFDKTVNRISENNRVRNEKVAVSLQRLIDIRRQRYMPRFGDIPWTIIRPEPVDPSFWWAQTDSFDTAGHTADFRDDGLHFWGGPKINKWNVDRHENFGAIASFALSMDRFPSSASGNFLSSPFVELFGGMTVFAPDWDLLQGHGIASCELFVRQTLFQWTFGMNGPAARTVGEAVETGSWRIYLKDTGYSKTLSMPGHKTVPPVSFSKSQLTPTGDLWAEIEVRFDIYLKSAGALVWCDPEVILRTFQWAPTAI